MPPVFARSLRGAGAIAPLIGSARCACCACADSTLAIAPARAADSISNVVARAVVAVLISAAWPMLCLSDCPLVSDARMPPSSLVWVSGSVAGQCADFKSCLLVQWFLRADLISDAAIKNRGVQAAHVLRQAPKPVKETV